MKELKRISVNILGGRDVGKSTVAMHVAAELRWLGIPTALQSGINKFWGNPPAVVHLWVHDVAPIMFTPHSLAELCRDTMTFLVRRRLDYKFESAGFSIKWTAADVRLEDMMRMGRVEYKSLPGVRASVPYIIDRICKEIGYGK